jgi:chemotaxis protein methyltransferase CheR
MDPPTPRTLAKEAFMAWKQPLREDQWQRLRLILRKYSGMDCPENRRDDLLQAAALAAKFAGDVDFETLIESLDEPSQEALRSVWISAYTIHETYFFRDGPQWQAIRQTVLPERIAARRSSRTLKIWSAGCSSGDEAYTAAIILDQLLPDADLWNIKIIGTDISDDIVQKARKGVYREWAFRQTPMHIRDDYFETAGHLQWKISDRLAKRVKFERLNLKTGVYPSVLSGLFDFDLILCRNVLIYFAREEMDIAITRMADCLAPGGFMALGPAEPTPSQSLPLELVASANSSIYRHKSPAIVSQPRSPYRSSHLGSTSGTVVPTFNPTGSGTKSAIDLLNEASKGLSSQDFRQSQTPTGSRPKQSESVPVTEDSGLQGLEKVRSLAESGKWQEAILSARELIAKEPLNAEAQYYLGLSHKELNHLADSREALRKCLFLDNKNWMAHLLSAGLWQREGQLERAKTHLAAILNGLAHIELAEVLPGTDGTTVGRMRALADSQLKHLEGRN